MSKLYDYLDEVTDISGLYKKEEAIRRNITAWFQQRLTIIESKYKEEEEKFWSWMLDLSRERLFNNAAMQPEPVPV